MTTILIAVALLLPLAEPPKKCTGQTPCPACSTCSRCRHCKVEGGTCGACQHPDNIVVRVIDGDTIVVQVNVRLLERAIRESWDIPEDTRQAMLARPKWIAVEI
jgi:endonuclease YncB( thermonuclease family)